MKTTPEQALADARRQAPLPPALRERLLAIPDPDAAREAGAPPAVPVPWPRQPLPAALRERLVAIPDTAGKPSWWLETRPLLAASYLLACLLSGLLGGFQAFGEQAVESGTRLASAVRTSVEELTAASAQSPDRLRRAVEPLTPDLEPWVGPLRELDAKATATWDAAKGDLERRWRDRREPVPAPRSLETPEPPASEPRRRDDETPDAPGGQAQAAPILPARLS